jgi:hypothetical protein
MADGEKWSRWRPFPDPRKREMLIAPIGAGCYQLRRRDTGELLIFGHARNVARRMSSLLPWKVGGGGHRGNSEKREYVEAYLEQIEYHTCACADRRQARELESRIRAERHHKFHT